jgi:hypothetical protein
VARRSGISPNQLLHWRKFYQYGSLSAVSAGEAVVPLRGWRCDEADPRITTHVGNKPDVIGFVRGGRHAAVIYSMLLTAKLNGLNPDAWLKETLEKLHTWPHSRLDELLLLRSSV